MAYQHKTARRWSKEQKAKLAEARKRAWADPEKAAGWKAAMREARKRAWADPEKAAAMREACKRAWADPEKAAAMREACKRAWADPEKAAGWKAAMREAHKRAWADPEKAAAMREARKRAWADPEKAAAMREARNCLTPEQVDAVIVALREVPQRRYIDIAADWLVSESTISRIAREAGLQRRPCRARAPRPELVPA